MIKILFFSLIFIFTVSITTFWSIYSESKSYKPFRNESDETDYGIKITGICLDGFYTSGKNKISVCANHGGIRKWLNN